MRVRLSGLINGRNQFHSWGFPQASHSGPSLCRTQEVRFYFFAWSGSELCVPNIFKSENKNIKKNYSAGWFSYPMVPLSCRSNLYIYVKCKMNFKEHTYQRNLLHIWRKTNFSSNRRDCFLRTLRDSSVRWVSKFQNPPKRCSVFVWIARWWNSLLTRSCNLKNNRSLSPAFLKHDSAEIKNASIWKPNMPEVGFYFLHEMAQNFV